MEILTFNIYTDEVKELSSTIDWYTEEVFLQKNNMYILSPTMKNVKRLIRY